jgi:hypothetical protein
MARPVALASESELERLSGIDRHAIAKELAARAIKPARTTRVAGREHRYYPKAQALRALKASAGLLADRDRAAKAKAETINVREGLKAGRFVRYDEYESALDERVGRVADALASLAGRHAQEVAAASADGATRERRLRAIFKPSFANILHHLKDAP